VAADALIAAFHKAVFLFGVPRWRPPRRSPGFEPRGIASLLFSVLAELKVLNADYVSITNEPYAIFIAILLLFFATAKN
jgi:hypothetical protein